ncbi:glycoside hydrolase family 61 protein [Geopyxis carbonaria]|nr:glycoside hydrolase family 61 protein [Geopyxis carbonaria]
MKSFAALALALAGSATAHTIFQELWVSGVSQGHLKGIRVPDYDGPITDVTSNDIICNGGINPYHTPLPTDIIDITAGATVTTEWHHTLSGADSTDSDDPISPGHLGPVMVYMAKVDSALTSTVTGLKWFKIYEDGMDANSKWGVDRLVANEGKVDVKIPSCIPAGNYLLRAELIALHGASSKAGAQFYMECAQINIKGGGSTSPSPTVAFPGAYSATDPGVLINIYYPVVTNYTVPGPKVFTC